MLETQAAHTVDLYVLCEVQILIRSLDGFPQVGEAGARSHTATHLILPLERGESFHLRGAPLGGGGLADLCQCLL